MTSPRLVPALWVRDLEQATVTHVDWFWQGYLAAGNITLLTSQWKAGKTTLLAILLIQTLADAVCLAFFCLRRLRSRVLTRSRTVWK